MTTAEAKSQLKEFLKETLRIVQNALNEIQPNGNVAYADLNNYSFTLNHHEEELLIDFQKKIERMLKIKLRSLQVDYRANVFDLLNRFYYDETEQIFTEDFNVDMLVSFQQELECRLDSIDVHQATFDGDQECRNKIDRFLKNYPYMKDRPGVDGMTLLYAAARRGDLDLVRNLVEKHRCSVDAQNLQDLKRALAVFNPHENHFSSNPRAGSTPLHVAAHREHLDVVKYLVEHGADYFIENQAGETVLMNAAGHTNVTNYFREILVFGYSTNLNRFPEAPIDEEANFIKVDCIWEFKRLLDQKWTPFDERNSDELHKSLVVQQDQEFRREIFLRTTETSYAICLMKFLRSGRNGNYGEGLAWIRCRGSSFVNLRCYALWQILLTKHPKASAQSTLDMVKLPVRYDSRFQLRLNTWFFCNDRTNARLDKAMKYRRRFVSIKVPLISDAPLKFNLETFEFTDKNKEIIGYLRWLPKMVSNNQRNRDEIIDTDEYTNIANLDPTPLTPARLARIVESKNKVLLRDEEELAEPLANEDFSYDDPSDKKHQKTPKKRSLFNLLNPKRVSFDESCDEPTWDNEPEEPIEQVINESRTMVLPTQRPIAIEEKGAADVLAAVLAAVKKKKDEFQKNLANAEAEIAKLVNLDMEHNAENQQRIRDLRRDVERLKRDKEQSEAREAHLRRIQQSIRQFKHGNIQKQIMQDVLMPKSLLIHNYLQQNIPNNEPYLKDLVPKIMTDEVNNSGIVTVIGFQAHNDEFKRILDRIQILSNAIQLAKDEYQKHLNSTMNSIVKNILPKVKPSTNSWHEYRLLLSRLFQEKNTEYKQIFDDYINDRFKSMIDPCILRQLPKPWARVEELKQRFIQRRPFSNEISSLKQKAFDEFIDKNISFQEINFITDVTDESIKTMKNFLQKVRHEFQNDPRYQGNELKHFNRIPKLLERLLLYFSSFKVQLPLFESAEELLNKIDGHLVTTIATSTGSGKSTLLPALLIAEGYDKVIVTQPRRLPCQLICKRVNETMKIDTGTPARELAGWEVSGAKYNSRAKVRYWTDGLLKECLLYNEKFITDLTNGDSSVVFFIDEVHERSVNIDICLALLAQLLYEKPYLKAKIKIIISSATLDSKVPDLFRQHFKGAVTEFRMPKMGTRFPVETIACPNKNIIDVVLEICKKRKRFDQILCFVNSAGEVNQCCRLISEISGGTITAYPLVQAQHPNVQQEYIENGSLFFSTTVAETSLTFPSLKYVVDTGMINIPVYDIKSRRTTLREMRAAQSTLTQRLGRLGRTQPGEYYSLYNFEPSKVPYPEPQICQSELTNLEFSLRKSLINQGLNYLKSFLPNPPSAQYIDATIKQLQEMLILDTSSSNQLTTHGEDLKKLPDFGSLAMSKSVLAALRYYNCGHDLICLAAFLGVLNNTNVLSSIPNRFRNTEDGDFMTLLDVIRTILSPGQSSYVSNSEIDNLCQRTGLTSIRHVVKSVLRRYFVLEDFFNKKSKDFKELSRRTTKHWEPIAKSLLVGYNNNIFISKVDLQGRKFDYIRHTNNEDIATLDFKSTLIRDNSRDPVSFVLARDIVYLTSVRKGAILSLLGEIKPEWINNFQINREILVTEEEMSHLNNGHQITRVKTQFPSVRVDTPHDNLILLKGSSGDVLNAELHIYQQMLTDMAFTLESFGKKSPHANFEKNLQSLYKMKLPRVFKALIKRRKAENQTTVTITTNKITKVNEISMKARGSVNTEIKNEFATFINWLQNCVVMNLLDAHLPPRMISSKERAKYRDIEDRIARVTDSKRTSIDLYRHTKGVHATRETRMEVVAWMAICKFGCRLEGGFVRDWIVGHYSYPPANTVTNSHDWIEYNDKNKRLPSIIKEIIPSDLDCHLPSYRYFDIEKFQDELHKYGIICTVVPDKWRYVILFDEHEPTGPFTMDLIEPHIALTHDRIDFDVNNLSVEKDYTHELGMRIDITQRPYSIDLETIIDNIQNKRFQVLRPRDSRLDERIDKMINIRGWKKIDQELSVIPQPHQKHYKVLAPLDPDTILYKDIKSQMSKAIQNIKILSIEEIRNPHLEEMYEDMKNLIKKECPGGNPKEHLLFHGTSGDGIEGIAENGFDDRYYMGGHYGRGAYFADKSDKSHNYTSPGETDNTRVIYYSRVLMGKSCYLDEPDEELSVTPKDCHSVIGRHDKNYTEYIVYRYGQALPYLKIVYTV